MARLPWIVGIAGVGLSMLAAAVLADYLIRRRRPGRMAGLGEPEDVPASNEASPRCSPARPTLPQAIPEVPGVETAIRYVAGSEGTDVGGDFGTTSSPSMDNHFIFVLGDVSGRGVEGGHHHGPVAISPFGPTPSIKEMDRPPFWANWAGFSTSIGTSRSPPSSVRSSTVPGHTVTLVNAGHPPLLLVHGTTGDFVRTTVFPPVGVDLTTVYEATDFVVPDHATLMAFTDGLIERRDESIDIGLERLRSCSPPSFRWASTIC